MLGLNFLPLNLKFSANSSIKSCKNKNACSKKRMAPISFLYVDFSIFLTSGLSGRLIKILSSGSNSKNELFTRL